MVFTVELSMPGLMLAGAPLLSVTPWPRAPTASLPRDRLTLSRPDQLLIQLDQEDQEDPTPNSPFAKERQ